METLEDKIKSVDILANAVRMGHYDVAPTYYEYLRLAFGLANDLGEAGRGYFHDLCRYNAKYEQGHANRQYDACLKRGATARPCTLGTVFELCRQAGVDMDSVREEIRRDWVERHKDDNHFSHNHYTPPSKKGGETPESVTVEGVGTEKEEAGVEEDPADKVKVEGSEPPAPLPTFPEHEWPWPFSAALRFGGTETERDAIFLSVATVLGATLDWTVRVRYGHDFRYPQMQTFVLAEAASGKSIIDYARAFAVPFHKERRRETEEAMRKYKRELQKYRTSLKKADSEVVDEPEKPKNKMFLIPANNSASGMIQCLIDSGGNGLIQESEADTLTIIMKSDFGNWSDVMRKTYDHGWISFNRRTDREFMEINHTRLAVLIAGTPSQLAPLIPSADNGLFSRETFYYMPANNTWLNQIDLEPDDTIMEAFVNMADTWHRVAGTIAAMGCHQLFISECQKERFNQFMRELMDETLALGNKGLRATVIRLGITMVRIASLIGICRIYGDKRDGMIRAVARGVHPDHPNEACQHVRYAIDDDDWEACLRLVPVLLRHASHVLSFLPSTEVKRTKRFERDEFIAQLPDEFRYSNVKALALKLNVSFNTAMVWVKKMVKAGLLEHNKEAKNYKKKQYQCTSGQSD